MRRTIRRWLLLLFAVLATVAVSTACATSVAGRPEAGDGVALNPVDPSFVHGTDHGPTDALAATAVTDVQDFWRQAFPATFGRPWTELRGTYSVDTDSKASAPAPCTGKVTDLEGNALYCPSVDGIAWDRTALLPVLRDHFGSAGVVLVLAHEVGHAVHNRAGITPARQQTESQSYPTILTESMADCYSGAFLRWVTDGHAPDLRITQPQLDTALGAIVAFRDPVGTGQRDAAAHGDAFDRMSSFEDGYQRGPKLCAGMTVANRHFTLQAYPNLDDRSKGGNLALAPLLSTASADMGRYFGDLLSRQAGRQGRVWQPPTIGTSTGNPRCTAGDQGPIALCPNDNSIVADTSATLPRIHLDIGDYATGTMLASRYALDALAALGRPVRGVEAERGALCLAGAYTGAVFARHDGFGLSPGDLDEAVQVLLSYDFASRDLDGAAIESGFARAEQFRAGVDRGPAGCGVG